uniref:Uncharacterized protein n=1 Tax=Chromera velia CCMP2878 TaxID=1169474 RepID=A0A0G4FCK1_9ALVE|eukprot:Cvel_16355.t1-p1 / transcript=Cvel_16355.t1 / gene=Cvel_16355 / organism=Chromera_velia_CCMP2878 / gene_product=hypothetical protein / transcript_product=hypothetical protein / location=Cvel_scaffold1256:2136-2429(+) / protein_length=98 / sequence_SO=supercontig / SO=protein_coding / is_pseudo=false
MVFVGITEADTDPIWAFKVMEVIDGTEEDPCVKVKVWWMITDTAAKWPNKKYCLGWQVCEAEDADGAKKKGGKWNKPWVQFLKEEQVLMFGLNDELFR